MKKLSAIFLAFTIVFSSVGSVIFFDGEQTAEAKSYKSGKKGFSNPGSTNFFQNKDNDTNSFNKSTTNNTTNKKSTINTSKKGGFTTGGLMKGLFVGGLAGLLFGSLFSDMGLIGNLLGFIINAAAIILIVTICIKIYQFIKRNKEVKETWRR